jgi:hypothetical protein
LVLKLVVVPVKEIDSGRMVKHRWRLVNEGEEFISVECLRPRMKECFKEYPLLRFGSEVLQW